MSSNSVQNNVPNLGRTDWIHVAEVSVLVIFGLSIAYINSQKVPALEDRIQALDVRQSVTEAHYGDILKSLERIERRLK